MRFGRIVTLCAGEGGGGKIRRGRGGAWEHGGESRALRTVQSAKCRGKAVIGDR